MNFDFNDKYYIKYFVYKYGNGSGLHWCDEYELIDGDGNVRLVNEDIALTTREIENMIDGAEFLEKKRLEDLIADLDEETTRELLES